MSLFYKIAYRFGLTPWERMPNLPAGEQASAMLDREEDGRQPPHGLALDLGCGTGIWSVMLAERGWEVTGVDIVKKAVDRAGERAREAGVEVRFVEAAVTALQTAGIGSGFRLVLDFGTVHGLTPAQREAVGREVTAVAAADATLLMFAFRTADGRKLRLLTIVDEYTRECLAIDVARRLNSEHVLTRLAELFVRRGVPVHIRSDNGPEFTARAVRHWLKRLGVQTLFIAPGSPWENGYVESFNGKLRDECLNLERFDTLLEAQVLVERWRCEYNQLRPHSSLGYRPPAPEAAPQPVTPGRLAPVLALT